MRKVHTVAEVREQVAKWHRDGLRVAFVPTMGNLHEGHLSLVDEAFRHADRVVVSIFVNPMQFGEGEDFDKYPRTLDDDSRVLDTRDASLLFAPSVEEMYARPAAAQTRVEVPGISDILCGASRPGHFVGVATVVCKLFNMVQADVAVFGEKDYQQLMVIRLMVSDLNIPVEIVGYPTVREHDGLAMSSRNGYLTEAERATAPKLFAVLEETKVSMQQGSRDYSALEQKAIGILNSSGFDVDYFTIRQGADLSPPDGQTTDFVILAAARLGTPRLIDNLAFTID